MLIFKKLNYSLIMKRIAPFLVILGAIILFFGGEIIPSGGRFLGGFDVAAYFYWNLHFIKEQILSGQIPLWNPYYYCGQPFIANPQTFVFYPSTLLFVFLPLPWAFTLDALSHFLLSAAGMYLFVLLVTDSKFGALISAVVYTFSAYFAGNCYGGHLTMIHTAALIPWIFFFIEKGLRDRPKYSFVAAGLFFGLQILGGEPQNNYYTLLFLSVYILYYLIVNFRKNDQTQTRSFFFCLGSF